MDAIHARYPGLDVHKKTAVACVRVAEGAVVRHEVRTFATKLYAKRDAKGKFEDIQSYKRAHGSDIKRSSAAERATASARKKAKKK